MVLTSTISIDLYPLLFQFFKRRSSSPQHSSDRSGNFLLPSSLNDSSLPTFLLEPIIAFFILSPEYNATLVAQADTTSTTDSHQRSSQHFPDLYSLRFLLNQLIASLHSSTFNLELAASETHGSGQLTFESLRVGDHLNLMLDGTSKAVQILELSSDPDWRSAPVRVFISSENSCNRWFSIDCLRARGSVYEEPSGFTNNVNDSTLESSEPSTSEPFPYFSGINRLYETSSISTKLGSASAFNSLIPQLASSIWTHNDSWSSIEHLFEAALLLDVPESVNLRLSPTSEFWQFLDEDDLFLDTPELDFSDESMRSILQTLQNLFLDFSQQFFNFLEEFEEVAKLIYLQAGNQ